jgi:hypothetical protein
MTALGAPLWAGLIPSVAGVAMILVMLGRYYARTPAATVEVAE